MLRRRRSAPLAIGLLLLVPLVASCSSETRDKARDAARSAGDDVQSEVDEVAAKVTAEAIATGIKARQSPGDDDLRDVARLREVVDRLVGSPQVSGIDDADGDGLDDDGKVEVAVEQSHACLTLPATGTDTTVANGRC